MIKRIMAVFVLLTAFCAFAYVLIYMPLRLSYQNFQFFRNPGVTKIEKTKQTRVEFGILAMGFVYSMIYSGLDFVDVRFVDDWFVPIAGMGKHTPIHTEALLTIGTLVIVGLFGFVCLKLMDVGTMPRFVYTMLVACLMLGLVIAGVWSIQIVVKSRVLLLLPINFIVMGLNVLKTSCALVQKRDQQKERAIETSIKKSYPIQSMAWALPLLVVIVLLLMPMGQKPLSVVTAWTHTSDWTLSMKQSPQAP